MRNLYLLIITILLLGFPCQTEAQPPNCTTNISPANISTNTDPFPFITFKWNTVSSATLYDIYISVKNPPKQLTATVSADSFNFYNASYNTTYYWYVVPKNADGLALGCISNITSFTTSPLPPPPSNDNCTGATSISTTPITGTTIGATQSMPADFCSGYTGTADDDVWYEFTATGDGVVVVSMTGNGSFDGVLEAFTGTCGSLAPMACSDTSQEGGREEVTLNVTSGTTYKIRIYSFYDDLSERGTFSISASGAPLPVRLLSFKGERRGNKNTLSWSTASEQNNKGFEVQYSNDGSNFNALSFIDSKAVDGNSTSVLGYGFIDNRSFNSNAYYRLKQVDKDGRSSFSNIVFLKGEKTNTVAFNNIYPNPAKNKLNITLNSPANEKISLVITDLAGKVMKQQELSLLKGDNNLPVEVAGLPAGSYFIKAIVNNGTPAAVSKFVKE